LCGGGAKRNSFCYGIGIGNSIGVSVSNSDRICICERIG
jgi:hypothetical protein